MYYKMLDMTIFSLQEFLTPQPEVKVLDLRHTQVGKNDVLVMGTGRKMPYFPQNFLREDF
jgi:hypothetical protein